MIQVRSAQRPLRPAALLPRPALPLAPTSKAVACTAHPLCSPAVLTSSPLRLPTQVRDDELFPADLMCLYSNLAENVCFIKVGGGARPEHVRPPWLLSAERCSPCMRPPLILPSPLSASSRCRRPPTWMARPT